MRNTSAVLRGRAGHALPDGGTMQPLPAVMEYLSAIERRLPGPVRARRAVIDELHDGLIEAVAA